MADFEVCYRHGDVRAGVTCQRCGRSICPDCMQQASVGFHCPTCVQGSGQRIHTIESLRVDPSVTKTLIAANVAAFLVGMFLDATPDSFDLTNEGLLYGPLVGVGEFWRLVTSGFLHANFIHIGFNMYLLWMLGSQMEPKLGHVRFGLLYLVGLLGGSLLVLILSPTQPTLGASGAVFGLMGALLVNQLANKVNPFDTGLGGLVAINLLFTFMFPNISIGGHLGGLLGGAAAGAVVFLGGPRRIPAPAIVAGLVGLAGLFAAASLLIAANITV